MLVNSKQEVTLLDYSLSFDITIRPSIISSRVYNSTLTVLHTFS